MFRKLITAGLLVTSGLLVAPPDANAVWINGVWYAKGVQEIGKVWYDSPFAGFVTPEVATRVFGIQANTNGDPATYMLSDFVSGDLTCLPKQCLTNPDSPRCTVPGNAQGTPYQVLSGSFSLTLDQTECLVKGAKNTCKVLKYSHILNADLSEVKACPGGFVPDFIPDPFIGRTSTCDPESRGYLIYDASGNPICSSDSQPATSLCQLVKDHGLTVGDPYTTQVEIPNDGTIISTDDYAKLSCTPNVGK